MDRLGPTTCPLTGLASLSMLAVRLEQIYNHCHLSGVRPSEAYALLVIDPNLGDRPPLVRDAIRVLIADEVRRSFSASETQAEVGTRIAILAAHTNGLRRAGVSLVRRLQRMPVLSDCELVTWIRPLPDEPGELSRFVLDLGF
jgi:hypothetical protein